MKLDNRLSPEQIEQILNEYHIKEKKERRIRSLKYIGSRIWRLIGSVIFIVGMFFGLPVAICYMHLPHPFNIILYLIMILLILALLNKDWKKKKIPPINTPEDFERELRKIFNKK